MKTAATSVDEYLAQLPAENREAMSRLRATLKKNLPRGFEETIVYGMIGYVVPLKTYPAGYHAGKNVPLPFVQLAQQKNYVALYHMGLTADSDLLAWFRRRWAETSPLPLDMGQSCIRLKRPESAPLDVLAELARKLTPNDWIARYEAAFAGGAKSSPKASKKKATPVVKSAKVAKKKATPVVKPTKVAKKKATSLKLDEKKTKSR